MHDLLQQTTRDRRRAMLRTAMGPVIGPALQDPAVIEVMVNPDGRLWLDRHGEGRIETAESIVAHEVERIIRLVASHIRAECHAGNPIVSAELPETGERFEGLLPPVSTAPCFAIRKPAGVLFRLCDYVDTGVMNQLQADALSKAVLEKRNIVVVGGTSSGKTTLVNALLAEVRRIRHGTAKDQDWRRFARRLGTLDAAAPPGSDCRRRNPRSRSARYAQGLEHRPPWRRHDAARQLGPCWPLPAGAAGPGGGGCCSPAPGC